MIKHRIELSGSRLTTIINDSTGLPYARHYFFRNNSAAMMATKALVEVLESINRDPIPAAAERGDMAWEFDSGVQS